jgi:hypothetical protein
MKFLLWYDETDLRGENTRNNQAIISGYLRYGESGTKPEYGLHNARILPILTSLG